MNGFVAFLRKELLEYTRTYKLFIMLAVFTIFGIMNPLTAKLLPDILGGLMTDGIVITLPTPSALDSWAQFFKNATQICLIVTALVFSGVLSSELSRGTLINMLTKGLSRAAVILAKYSGMVLIWTASIWLCFGLTLGYTVWLFPNAEVVHLFFSAACLWLFGVFLLALLLLAATLTKSSYGGLLIVGAAVIALTLLNLAPGAREFNPLTLVSDNMALLTGDVEPSALYAPALISLLLSAVSVASAMLIFRKKQL